MSHIVAVTIRRLADSIGISYKSIHRCASVRMGTLISTQPNPELKTLAKIMAYLLRTGQLALRLHVLCRMVIRSHREGKDIVIRLHEPDAPLHEGEDTLLMYRPLHPEHPHYRRWLRHAVRHNRHRGK